MGVKEFFKQHLLKLLFLTMLLLATSSIVFPIMYPIHKYPNRAIGFPLYFHVYNTLDWSTSAHPPISNLLKDVIFWFLVSCLILYLFQKIKKMGVKEFWKKKPKKILFSIALLLFLIILLISILFLEIYSFSRPVMQIADPYEPCDNDRDGDCDKADYELVTQAIGGCEDTGGYNALADANHDGCVTERDREILFPIIPEK